MGGCGGTHTVSTHNLSLQILHLTSSPSNNAASSGHALEAGLLKILPSGSPATHTKGHNPPHRRRYDNQWNQSFNAKETMLVSVFYSSGLHTWKEFHEYDTWQWQWNSLDRQMISMCLMFYWLYNWSSTRKSKEVWTARQFCFIPSLAECCPGTPASQP